MKNMERPVPAPRAMPRHRQFKPPIPERHREPFVATVNEKLDLDVKPSTSTECIPPLPLSSPPHPALSSDFSCPMAPPPIPQKPLRLSVFHSDGPNSPPSGSASTSRCSSSFSPHPPQKLSLDAISPTSEPVSPCSSIISDINCDFSKPPPIPARRKSSPLYSPTSLPAPFPGVHHPVVRSATVIEESSSCHSPTSDVCYGNLNGVQPFANQELDKFFASKPAENIKPPPMPFSEFDPLTSPDDRPDSGVEVSIRRTSSPINVYPKLPDDLVRESVNLIDFSDNVELSKISRIENYSMTQMLLQNGNTTKGSVEPVENNNSLQTVNHCGDIKPLNIPPPKPPLREPEKALGLIEDFASPESKLELQEGIWNPRYIGLEEYRRLVEKSNSAPAAVTFEPTRYTPPPSVDFNSEDLVSQRDSLDVSNGTERSGASSSIEGESVCFSGWVHLTVHKKDRGNLWAVLRSGKLSFFRSDDEEEDAILGPYDLLNAVYVGRSPKNRCEVDVYIKENSISVHWTHLAMISEQSEHWVLLTAKCFMPKHDTLTHSFRSIDAGGVVWIRQGATCPWSEGWMHLDQRRLFYALENCMMLFELDVRKFIAMKSDVAKVDWCASVAGSQKGPFLLTLDGCSLYVQADNDAITTLWADLLGSEMEKTSNKLEDHKLTADDVPIIVDKCIKFIATYGLFQPGLYRRNGSNVEARVLMEELKKDPVNVHITPGYEDMVNVVADVLRTFFRQLEAPLIPDYVQKRLFAISEIRDTSRLNEYHEVLMSLPRIRLQTLRRMLSHLKDVTEHAHANLASVENIAKVFGPTLFSVDQGENAEMESFAKTVQQVNVLKDLLTNYAVIFRVSVREMHAKSKMDLLQGKANTTKARADGFLVPIHLIEKDSHTFNVQSSLNAEQVCEAARNRPSFCDDGYASNFALFEVIKSGQLERRVGWKEKMSTMVAGRWLDWDPTDCYLIFKRDLLPFSFDRLYAFADDVKMAEPGSKSFSTCHLKLETGTTIVQYNKSLKQVNEWHVDEILWFAGHEASRKPPYPYTLTFIVMKKNFKYKSKFVGNCIAFRENIFRMQWLNAALSSQQNFQAAPSS